MDKNLIFDSIPFSGFIKTSNKIHATCRVDITKQGNIIDDIVLCIHGNLENRSIQNYFIFGVDGVGKTFILKELESFLEFRSKKVLFLNPENFAKIKKKIFSNQIIQIHEYIIIDDWDCIKKPDKDYIKTIIYNYDIHFIISSSKNNIKSIDKLFVKNGKIYKLHPLSFLETYHYINSSVNISYALNTLKSKRIFSISSIFIIYMLSAGKLSYINNISAFCLDLLIKSKRNKIYSWYVLKYIKKNLKTLHNTFKLFIKTFLCSLFILCVVFIAREIYLRVNKAEFERIREEIELQNLKNSI